MPLSDLLPWRRPGPAAVEARPLQATTVADASVLPARSGFVQGIPPGGMDETQGAFGTATSSDRATLLQELWEAYLGCPWAWACVNAIARTVTAAGITTDWDADTGEGDPQPDKPPEVQALERFFAYCNPTQDIRQLCRNVVADLQVFGDAFLELVWVGHIPVAVYNLDCPTTFPHADQHGTVSKYVQKTEFGQIAEFEPRQVIHITLDSARPSVFGISPTHAAQTSIITWMFVAANIKEMARRGFPPTIHADHPTGTAEPEITRWSDQYQTRNIGPQNVGTPITTKGGGKVTELQPAKLLDLLKAKDQSRDEIVSDYGVPPAKVGIIEAGNLGGGTGTDQNKALDLMTMIPTPAGWTTMGELKPGDQVLDENGRPCNVVSTHEVPDAVSWRLNFSDGTHIDCCLDHLWVTWTRADRKAYGRSMSTADLNAVPANWPQWRSGRGIGPRVRRTEEVLATLHDGGRPNHSIPVTGPLDLPEADLPIDPYTLGAWLGDGTTVHAAITCADSDRQILDGIRAAGFTVTERPSSRRGGYCPSYGINGGFLPALRANDLLGNKHVPAAYLRASAAQRLALLQGLMDTDGGWGAPPQCVFVSSLEHLADAVRELARSLGQKPVKAKRDVVIRGIEYSPSFRVTWTPTVQPFRLRRKADRFKPGNALAGMRVRHRTLVSAEKIPDRPMRCIKVNSPNSMYLAGEGMIPTHNTFMLDLIWPIGGLVAEKFQFHIAVQGFGVRGWHVQFGRTDYRDDQVIENIRDLRVRNGTWTVNRSRADAGEPGTEGGDVPILVARQDVIAISDIPAMSKATIASKAGGPVGPDGTLLPIDKTTGGGETREAAAAVVARYLTARRRAAATDDGEDGGHNGSDWTGR